MPGVSPQAGPEVAALSLRKLLAQPGRYRAYWARRADRTSPGEISQAAVARVIAERLQASGKLAPDDSYAYRALKDRVNRALSGRSLTQSTLSLFAEAFLFAEDDARHLWSELLGAKPSEVGEVVGSLALPPSDAAAFEPVGYRVVSLHEIHEIGADGSPYKHMTRQEIAATDDGLARCPIRFDTDAFEIVVPNGLHSKVYRCPDGLYAVDIHLPVALRRGERANIEYAICYSSPRLNDRQFMRSAMRRPIDDATVEVRFDSGRHPAKIWWAIWHDLGNYTNPALREEVPLDLDRHSVVKRVTSAIRIIFGFCWEW